MPATVCPHCGTDVELNAQDAGELVECPACQKAFTAPLPVARRVHRPQLVPRPHRWRRAAFGEHSSPESLIDHAECECGGPADNLFANGLMTAFGGLGATVFGGITLFGGPVNNPRLPGMSDEQTAAFYFVYGLYALLVGAFQMYAGRQMRRVRQYSICVIACIMAVIPGVGPCIIGTLFGFVGLMKLRDPWVRKGFAANRPGFDPDTAT